VFVEEIDDARPAVGLCCGVADRGASEGVRRAGEWMHGHMQGDVGSGRAHERVPGVGIVQMFATHARPYVCEPLEDEFGEGGGGPHLIVVTGDHQDRASAALDRDLGVPDGRSIEQELLEHGAERDRPVDCWWGDAGRGPRIGHRFAVDDPAG
jgi:hypothetical protein